MPDALSELTYSVIGEVDAAPRSIVQARRRAEQASEKANEVMRSRGYYGAQITARIVTEDERSPTEDDEISPVLTIATGPQFLFDSPKIAYSSETPDISDESITKIQIKAGSPALSAEVVAAEARITGLLRAKGYPFAKAEKRKAIVDHDAETLSVTFNFDAGQKTRFGTITQTGTAYLAEGWPQMIAPFEQGEVFDDRKLNRLAARVIGTGVFAGASASLSENHTQNKDGTITRDVILDVEQGAINTVLAEAGFSTSQGSGIDLTYERRNFIGYAQSLKLRNTLKTNEISLSADYNIPFAWRVDRELDIGVSLASEDTEGFKGRRANLNTLLTQKFSPKFKAAFGAGLEASQYEEDRIDVRSYLFRGLLSADYDSRTSLLNPQKGYHIEADLTPTYNFGDEDGFFTNAELGAATYRKVSEKFTVAGRVKVASIFGASQDSVPLNRRYYGGGGGSVRGYEFQSISPINEDGDLIGGRSLFETSAELRYRSDGKLGYVSFVDMGSVATTDVPDFGDMRYGIGGGVRYYTSFAPLRADIAFPINKSDGDADFQIYLSIGQAF